MFGYIRVAKQELRIKEYELYKAVYCTLCKRLGRDYGFATRFMLSYDFTFTALMELALADEFCGVEAKKCVCNPLKKCNYCKSDEQFALSAAALIILSFYKLKDDVQDEKGFKKLRAVILKALFGSAYKKAAKNFNDVDYIARQYYEEQKKAEERENCGLDDAAEPSSKMLSLLLPMCARDENDKMVLSYLGRLIGRYIYLLDCFCDREKDIKNGSFNPISKMEKEEAKERIQSQLYIVINEAEKSFELLNIKRFKNILGNIIYVGLEDTMKTEINRTEKSK